jgi:hypothetical protein
VVGLDAPWRVSRTLRQLSSRIVFNILVSNTDDHARNRAAFWDGNQLPRSTQPKATGRACGYKASLSIRLVEGIIET